MNRLVLGFVVVVAVVVLAAPAFAGSSPTRSDTGKPPPSNGSSGDPGKPTDPGNSGSGGSGSPGGSGKPDDPGKSGSQGQSGNQSKPTSPGNSGNSKKPASTLPGPKAAQASKAKAYGIYCRDQSKKRVSGSGTPFSQCLTAMAKLASGQAHDPWAACSALPRKPTPGQKGSAFTRCVIAGTRLLNDLLP